MKNTLPFHLQNKYPGTFANRKYKQLSYLKNRKMCDPILLTPSKMQPHYSQSGRENATRPSDTSPLASHKEVPRHPGISVLKTLTGNRAEKSFLKLLKSVTKHGFVFLAQRKLNAILEICKAFQDRLTFLNRHMII